MKLEFRMTCYPGTESEEEITITIGTMAELAPNDLNYPDPKNTYCYFIRRAEGKEGGISHYGFTDYFKAQASAMLHAVCYGNGGFPLENHYLR